MGALSAALLAFFAADAAASDSDENPDVVRRVRRMEAMIAAVRGADVGEPIALVTAEPFAGAAPAAMPADAIDTFGWPTSGPTPERGGAIVYDEARRSLRVAARLAGAAEVVTLARELARAERGRRTNLVEFLAGAPDADQAAARRAVIEGEADLVADGCIDRFADELARDLDAKHLDRVASVDLAATAFVRGVHRERGWSGVDDLYLHPPTSTEQVVHPEKFLGPAHRDEPRPVALRDLAPDLGAGWALLREDVMGEVGLETFVRGHGDPVRAVQASRGWGGDRYRVYRNGSGAVLVQACFVFDTNEDAAEMIDALRKVWQRRFSPTGTESPVTMDEEQTGAEVTTDAGVVLARAERDAGRVVLVVGLEPGLDPERLLR